MELNIWGRFGSIRTQILDFEVKEIESTQKNIFFIDYQGNLHHTEDIAHIIEIPIRFKALKISCGIEHCGIITESGELFTFGKGNLGALGLGDTTNQPNPTKVNFLTEFYIEKVSCGGWHTTVIGKNSCDQKVLLTCGRGSEGQLGIGKTKKELNFVKIENFNETIHEICSGINHTGLITSGKSVYVTGDNRFGQLGLGHKRNVYYYEKNLSLENASKISFGHHSSALINGKLFLFGTGVFGELLDPKMLECQENIVDMKIGECSGIAISESKQLWSWGSNIHGELGKNFQNDDQLNRIDIKDVETFMVGDSFSAFLTRKRKPTKRQLEVNTSNSGKTSKSLTPKQFLLEDTKQKIFSRPIISDSLTSQRYFDTIKIQNSEHHSTLLTLEQENSHNSQLLKEKDMFISDISKEFEKIILENKELRQENIQIKTENKRLKEEINHEKSKLGELKEIIKLLEHERTQVKVTIDKMQTSEESFFDELEQNLAKKAEEFKKQSILNTAEINPVVKSYPNNPFKVQSLNQSMSLSEISQVSNTKITPKLQVKNSIKRNDEAHVSKSSRTLKNVFISPRSLKHQESAPSLYKKGFEDIKNKVKVLRHNRSVIKNQVKVYENKLQVKQDLIDK